MTYKQIAEQLTLEYNKHTKSTGVAHSPTHLFVGMALFDVYLAGAGKLCRWSSEEPADKSPPLFKTTKMEAVKSLGPWEIVFGRKVILEQTIE